MRYQELLPISRADALVELESLDRNRISTALVSLALHERDRIWLEDLLEKFMTHDDAWVRGTAALCVGHVARLHRKPDEGRLIPLLRGLLEHADTAGKAEDALEDIAIFVRPRP